MTKLLVCEGTMSKKNLVGIGCILLILGVITVNCFDINLNLLSVNCKADRGGNVGVVYYAPNATSLDQLLNASTDLQFIIIMPINLFSR